MPEAAVTTEVHQTLDVQRHVAAQIAFDAVAVGDHLADARDLLIGERVRLTGDVDVGLQADVYGVLLTNAVNRREGNPDGLPTRKVDACDACHCLLSLSLLVARVLADHANDPAALDDLALLTNRFDRCSNLHGLFPMGAEGRGCLPERTCDCKHRVRGYQ